MEFKKDWALIDEYFSDFNIKNVLANLYKSAFEHQKSIALWRRPLEDKKNLVIDMSSGVNWVSSDLEELGQGFIFSPFHHDQDKPSVFINNHLHFNFTKTSFLTVPGLSGNSIYETARWEFMESVKTSIIKEIGELDYYVSERLPDNFLSKTAYLELVNKAISAIEAGKFDKVVPSRCVSFDLQQQLNIIELFEVLCDTYPNALVSLVSLPGIGTWMGATPETLISTNEEDIFKTVALAGTQRIEKDTDLMDVAWTQKEIEEQAMVSRYIINCFKKIRLREFEEYGPRTARAGELAHLKTDFLVDMLSTNFPQLGTVMLELLHPTSAVCGMNKIPALEFLLENERFDRSFFSGFLGPVNIKSCTDLFVNIRCMQLAEKKAYLYAGAGVTAISNPEKEWLETNMKLETMLKVLPG